MGSDKLSWEASMSELFWFPSEKVVYSKRKDFAPKGEQILSF